MEPMERLKRGHMEYFSIIREETDREIDAFYG